MPDPALIDLAVAELPLHTYCIVFHSLLMQIRLNNIHEFTLIKIVFVATKNKMTTSNYSRVTETILPFMSPVSPTSSHPPSATQKVVVVFSEKTAEKIKQRIFVCLVCGLNEFNGISVTYYELGHRKAPSSWIEEMVGKASVVLAVCDESFKEEWLHGGESSVVHALHQTVRAEAFSGQELNSKYAVVLMQEHDEQYIPWLLKDNVHFNFTETDKIAHYCTSFHV